MIFTSLFSFSQLKFKKIEKVVNQDLVLFSKNKLPAELHESINLKRIIVLGETHYLQEHQEFVCNILNNLPNDSIIFITESIGINNWLVEDYMNGKINHLPNTIRFFDNYWIETIKKINKTDKNIQFYFMDVNHWKSNLKNNINVIEKLNGKIPEFQIIKAAKVDSEEYMLRIKELLAKMIENSDMYKKRFGDIWYHRYMKILKDELLSSNYRKTSNEELRERFMFDFIIEQIEKNPSKKILINCGMYHAQKETMMGTKIKRLAHFLNEKYPKDLFSVALIGIKGERKFNFYDENTIQFNILNETSKNNLTNIIGNRAGTKYSFLHLRNDIFSTKMRTTYISSTAGRYIPSNQFNAIITIPEVNLLKSMIDFDLK